MEKYCNHGEILFRYFLFAQKSVKCIKSIKTRSIVNEAIRGNFTSIKKNKKHKKNEKHKRHKKHKNVKQATFT